MKPTIVWMIDSLGPGGAEQLTLAILPYLKQSDFDIRVCALQVKHGNPIAAELEKYGLPVDLLSIPNLRHPFNLFKILKYLWKYKPQILHTQLEFSDILGIVVAKFLGIKTVSTLHTLDEYNEKASANWRLQLRWFILKYFCDRIVAVSQKTQQHHQDMGGLNSSKLITIYNGIDLQRFHRSEPERTRIRTVFQLPSETPVLVTIAVLRELKGIQYMLAALPAIVERIPNVQYLIVGDGAFGTSLRSQVKELNLEKHIVFAGHRTDIPAILSASDLFILPTLKDALPTVLIETLAARVPVIASNIGGVPEIIEDQSNGLLVEPGNAHALTLACLRLLQDKALVEQLTQRGYEIASERFSLEGQILNLSKLYQELI